MNKKVSIITSSYNYEQYIEQSIESVIHQTYSNWELIIVDDGSIDNSVEIIKKYKDKDNRIKLYTHENNKNLGLIKTLELGIKNSTGDFIVFLEFVNGQQLLYPSFIFFSIFAILCHEFLLLIL